MCIKNLEKCNKIMHVAKRNVILLYFSKLQIQYATNFYINLFHIIDTYTIEWMVTFDTILKNDKYDDIIGTIIKNYSRKKQGLL